MPILICPHQPSCPGCPRLSSPGLPPDPLARLERMAARAGIAAPTVHPSPQAAFRMRARLAIRGRADAPKLGIFEAGTHRVVHIPRCLVHHPVVNAVAADLRDALARQRVPTYSDQAHLGVVRYAQIVVERSSQLAQLTLVTNGMEPGPVQPLLDELRGQLGSRLQGLFWNGNPERSNTILGPHWLHVGGEPHVVDSSGSARIFYPPGAFGQSNLELAMQLAARVRELAGSGERVTEFYAGVGAIGLGLAEKVRALRLNELGEGSLLGLRQGVAALDPALQERTEVAAGPAGAHAALVRESELVIADPPRKGLDPELREALAQTPPPRFIYVSCDIDSFERDVAALEGGLRLTQLEAYDLFPHTEHLETLALFERR